MRFFCLLCAVCMLLCVVCGWSVLFVGVVCCLLASFIVRCWLLLACVVVAALCVDRCLLSVGYDCACYVRFVLRRSLLLCVACCVLVFGWCCVASFVACCLLFVDCSFGFGRCLLFVACGC